MGRFVKHHTDGGNVGTASSTQLPAGTTAERPASPADGQIRFNTDSDSIEYYDGTSWDSVGSVGLVPITRDVFAGNASLTSFTMSQTVSDEHDILVFIGGVFQNPTSSYTVNGSTTITFTSPPPNLETVIVLHGYNKVV